MGSISCNFVELIAKLGFCSCNFISYGYTINGGFVGLLLAILLN